MLEYSLPPPAPLVAQPTMPHGWFGGVGMVSPCPRNALWWWGVGLGVVDGGNHMGMPLRSCE